MNNEDPTQPLAMPDNQAKTRDELGRLLPGHTGNPLGRPKRKTLTELLHDRLDKTENGWEDLVSTILLLVGRKDKDIIKELWHYTDGKPKESVDIQAQVGFTVILKREP